MNYNFFLKQGDKIGIFAPSSDFDQKEFSKGIETIKKEGLIPVYNKKLTEKSSGYLKFDDNFRKKHIEDLLLNKDIKVIIAARGGYGAIRTLNSLDRKLLIKSKKLIAGFSDITIFHVFMNKNNIPTLHSLMVAAFSRNKNATKQLFRILKGEIRELNYKLNGKNNKSIKGYITGGNLAVITSLAGTKYFTDFKDKILFLEDINEPLYKIDRMLMQLKLSNINPSAIVLGQFSNCGRYSDIISVFTKTLPSIPIFYGLNIGHINETESILLGMPVEINDFNLKITF